MVERDERESIHLFLRKPFIKNINNIYYENSGRSDFIWNTKHRFYHTDGVLGLCSESGATIYYIR